MTNEFILGLDALCLYDISVDLGRRMLRLSEEEMSLWRPGEGPRPSNLVVPDDKVMIPALYVGVVMDRLESLSEWKRA
jgi:hypothetical protein